MRKGVDRWPDRPTSPSGVIHSSVFRLPVRTSPTWRPCTSSSALRPTGAGLCSMWAKLASSDRESVRTTAVHAGLGTVLQAMSGSVSTGCHRASTPNSRDSRWNRSYASNTTRRVALDDRVSSAVFTWDGAARRSEPAIADTMSGTEARCRRQT